MTRLPFRVAVPAGLLVVASALSSSTACLSAGAVAAIGVAGTAGIAGVAAAGKKLEENRLRRVGNLAQPTVTADPASLAAALRPALPDPAPAGLTGEARVEVVQLPDEGSLKVYRIRAYGEFTPEYAQAYANYSNRLRTQLPAPSKFILVAIRDARGRERIVAQLEVN